MTFPLFVAQKEILGSSGRQWRHQTFNVGNRKHRRVVVALVLDMMVCHKLIHVGH
jgi:hypothetical protein